VDDDIEICAVESLEGIVRQEGDFGCDEEGHSHAAVDMHFLETAAGVGYTDHHWRKGSRYGGGGDEDIDEEAPCYLAAFHGDRAKIPENRLLGVQVCRRSKQQPAFGGFTSNSCDQIRSNIAIDQAMQPAVIEKANAE